MYVRNFMEFHKTGRNRPKPAIKRHIGNCGLIGGGGGVAQSNGYKKNDYKYILFAF